MAQQRSKANIERHNLNVHFVASLLIVRCRLAANVLSPAIHMLFG
jgi:hypothetical protein